MTRRPLARHSAARQRGAATLIVVMVLFFLVSLMAAYTSRNMIFEQKTSANQARATQAFEAAEAGLEWALTMLNGGVVGPDCSGASPANSFRQRYLVVDPVTGVLTPTLAGRAGKLLPTCVYSGAGWSCTCPDTTAADPGATPVGGYTGPQPAFRVRLLQYAPPGGPTAGVVRVEATACTRLDESCLGFAPTTTMGDGVATVSTLVALRTGLAVTPAAAVTAGGKAVPSGLVTVSNADATSNGITVQMGGGPLTSAERANLQASSLPGTPGALTILEQDATLAGLASATIPDRMFAAVFGMRRQAYQQQPGLRACASPCSASSVNALLAANPDRPVWVAGNLTLDTSIGSATAPAIVVIDGNITAGAAGASITGLVYLNPASATIGVTTSGTVTGALVADNDVTLPASLTVNYDAPTLARLRTTYGSYVRIPGGWHDWQSGP